MFGLEELFVVLLASCIGAWFLLDSTKRTLSRKIQSIRVQRRPNLEFFGSVDPPSSTRKSMWDRDEIEHTVGQFRRDAPIIYRSLAGIRDFIIADFIQSWYSPYISSSMAFSSEVSSSLDYAFWALSSRIVRVDWRVFFMQEMVKVFEEMLCFVRLTEDELVNRKDGFLKLNESSRTERVLKELQIHCNLHPGTQDPVAFLRTMSSTLTKLILRKSDYASAPVRALLKEVLTQSVFIPVMGFASPYWLNIGFSYISFYIESNPESRQVNGDEDTDTGDLEQSESDYASVSEEQQGDLGDYVLKRSASSPEIHRRKKVRKYYCSVNSCRTRYHNHKPYVVYRVDVRYGKATWSIWKRFSQFLDLHKRLTSLSSSFKGKLSRRRFGALSELFDHTDAEYIQKRIVVLNDYVQKVVFDNRLTQSVDWRQFLIPSDLEQEIIEVPSPMKTSISKSSPSSEKANSSKDYVSILTREKDKASYASLDSNLTKPLYDLMGEVFELEKRGWVRRQVGWILKHVLHGFDNKVNKLYHSKYEELATEENLAALVDSISSLVWPNGVLIEPSNPPTAVEMERAYSQSRTDLQRIVPNALKTFLGSEFVESRVDKLHKFFQLEPVVQHLAFVMLERFLRKLTVDERVEAT